jgi:hypothetical protein
VPYLTQCSRGCGKTTRLAKPGTWACEDCLRAKKLPPVPMWSPPVWRPKGSVKCTIYDHEGNVLERYEVDDG